MRGPLFFSTLLNQVEKTRDHNVPMGAQMGQLATRDEVITEEEISLEDLESLVRTLMNNSATIDLGALQQGIEHLRSIRSMYTNKANTLHAIIVMLETAQFRRTTNAGS